MSKQRTSAFTWIAAIFFGFVVYSIYTVDSYTPSSSSSTSTGSQSAASGQLSKPEEQGWQYWESKDKLTDESVHYAHFKASEGWIYDVESWVRCKTKKKELDIIFEVGDFIGSGDYRSGNVKVEYRFDSNPVTETNFLPSTEGNTVFVKDGDLQKFISGMTEGSKLRLRVYDYQGTPHDAEIPLKGTSATIPKVVQACL